MDIRDTPNPYLPVLTVGVTGVQDRQFAHPSNLHGASHVNRVICWAFHLASATDQPHLYADVWAAAYLHDLSRRHDELCYEHGRWAVEENFDSLYSFFAMAGATRFDQIREAVIVHSLPEERPDNPVCQLLKDADGLDRARLGDLDPRYLRHEVTRSLVEVAEELFARTYGKNEMADIWPVAQALFDRHGRTH